MIKLFKDIKTTLCGSIAGLPQIIQGFQTHNYMLVVTGISTLLLGVFAKDHDTIK